MPRMSKQKVPFKLKKDARFKGKQRTLKIEKGTISKFNQKKAFLTNNKYKVSKTATDQSPKNSKKKSVFQEKTEKRKISKTVGKETKIQTKIAKLSALQVMDKTLSSMGQEEDYEGVNNAKNTAKNANRAFKTTKRASNCFTKKDKFSKGVTKNKVNNVRFSSKKMKKSTAKKIIRTPQKTVSKVLSKGLKNTIEKGLLKSTGKALLSTPFGWIAIGVAIILALLIGLMLMGSNQSSGDNGAMYVKH